MTKNRESLVKKLRSKRFSRAYWLLLPRRVATRLFYWLLRTIPGIGLRTAKAVAAFLDDLQLVQLHIGGKAPRWACHLRVERTANIPPSISAASGPIQNRMDLLILRSHSSPVPHPRRHLVHARARPSNARTR